MYNLHRYLFLTFQKAIRDGFSDINIEDHPVRFYISNKDCFDICTPVARRLQSVIKFKSGDSIARQLLLNICWNNEYIISNDKSAMVANGFINLTISRNYLQRILLRDIPLVLNPKKIFHDHKLDNICKKLKRLTDHAQIIGMNDQTVDNSSLSLLSHRFEHKILVLLAVLEFPDTLTGKSFIIDKLLKLAYDYYMTIPIITSSSLLSRTRLLLIRRLLERTHQHYTNQ